MNSTATEEAPVTRSATELTTELKVQASRLSTAEQLVLAGMIDKVKATEGREVSALNLIHQNLTADWGSPIPDVMASVTPPLVKAYPGRPVVPLPTEYLPVDMPLDKVLLSRLSSHNYGSSPISLATLSTLLRYSYGVRELGRAYNSRTFPFRLAPSGGGLQPVDLYLVANDITDLDQGLYYFDGLQHALIQIDKGTVRRRFTQCCIMQDWISDARLVVILAINMDRVFWKYGNRGYRVTHMDAGVLTQNLYLVTTALGLSGCAVAGYYDARVNELLEIDGENEFATLIYTIGNKATPIRV
jgi:SagB-type dehydrogenase family enzyme